MGLRFDPVGGGQFKAAVQQMVEAERQPIKGLEARKSKEEARLKLFQEFKGKFAGIDKALGELSNFTKFREYKVDLGDGTNFVGVTVDKERAQPGTYTVEVTQLASRSSIMSNSFSNPDESILGIGYVVVDLPDGSTSEIFVDEKDASLRGVAALINKDQKSPLRASVVKDSADPDKPWRLILSSKNDGADDGLTFPDFYFLDSKENIYVDDQNDSQNALLKVDGFEIQAGSNDIPDFLQGVNLHLKQARPDQPFTISITEDKQKMAGKVKDLVTQVNSILEFINKQNQVDDKSDTRTTFAGDSGLQTIEYRLRNLLHEGFPGTDVNDENFRRIHMNQLGIEFGKNGLLNFNEERFTKNIETDFDGVGEAITGPYGFASQLKEVISSYTSPGQGFLNVREQALRTRIKKIDDDISNKERRVEQRQKALVEQFSRLQSSLANLQRQSQYLQATLPTGGGNNLVSQLLGG